MDGLLFLIIGLVLGAVLAWLWSQKRAGNDAGRTDELRTHLQRAENERSSLQSRLASEGQAKVKAETQLSEADRNLKQQQQLLDEAKTKLADTFKALSSDALKSNSDAIATGIKNLIAPLDSSLKQYAEQVKQLENKREKAYGSLEQQLKVLAETQQLLEKETGNLVSALRRPSVRGRWGEVTLRRVVELAGMSAHCDFSEQSSLQSEGGTMRPDMVVHLPAGRQIVVDAKLALDAYLDAMASDSHEERNQHLKRHARQLRTHMNKLAEKAYWSELDQTPEFVVMFIPGESFFASAVEQDRKLIEDGMRNRVVMGTPTTLISLLQAVAYGWRQQLMAENAKAISELGKDLYDRIRILGSHVSKLGRALKNSNDAYNSTVASLESRVLVTARRLKEMGAASNDEIEPIDPLETTTRTVAAAELTEEKKGLGSGV